MVWRWWWRRRRWAPRRRWRRWRTRRVRRRGRRRPARSARRPRVRRLRWRRGWRRRRYIRRRRRRKRKKIVIRQWNPAVTKKLTIGGYIPLLICGSGDTNTTFRNYGSNMHNYVKYNSYGGGFSTLLFNLRILFEEYLRHHNYWSKSNENLELIRYRGCTFKLFRDPETDFIVKYSRKPPFVDDQLTGPSMHPGMLMTSKRKIKVPSYRTRPKGRSFVKINIPPPTLFTDRWYFQKDLCQVPLMTIGASTASLRFPFCSPQTNNICIYFQVLHPWYNSHLSIEPETVKKNYTDLINYLKTGYTNTTYSTPPNTNGNTQWLFNTFKTQEHIINPPADGAKNTVESGSQNAYTKVNSLYGDAVYNLQIVELFQQNAKNFFQARKKSTFSESEYLNYRTGMFSPIFLTNGRLSPDFPGFYLEVVYNPLNDKGIGNIVWMDWCLKNDSIFKDTPSRLPIKDVPLWACFLGYQDYCSKHFHDPGINKEARVTIICPYTEPPLTNKDNPLTGFVPYDYNFGQGKMPDGNGYINMPFRFKWYPCMYHQQGFMNDITQCGPFAYHADQKAAVLTAKYKFHFILGGNPIVQQTVKDPCKQPDFPIPGGGGLPRAVQIQDPRFVNEATVFRTWDIRRHFFGAAAIKRVLREPYNAEFFAGPPKRSRFEVPALPAEDDYCSRERKLHPWSESSQEEEETDQEVQEEVPAPLEQQLKIQIQQQRDIKSAIRHIVKQLIKTQSHLHAPTSLW
nr:ORF1 [Alphatorquevirus sp.]